LIAKRCKLVIFSLAIGFFQAEARVNPRLNDEGCANIQQELALAELRSQYKDTFIPHTKVKMRCDRGARCDGGFIWQPFTVSRQRAWVVYALPSIIENKEWVSVSIYNICSKRLVMYGLFLNEEESLDLYGNAAFVRANLVDQSQTLYSSYEELFIKLYKANGVQRLSIVGAPKNEKKLVFIDDFLVEAL
jgi:uncharacterized circularly permuted ATP-grasp superfamily protein